MKPPKVVVAIDFGTHGTGYAYVAVSRDNDDPEVRDARIAFRPSWPDAPPRGQSGKELTAIAVDAKGRAVDWGFTAKLRWADTSPERRAALGLGGFAYAFKMALSPIPETRSVAQAEGTIDLTDEVVLRTLIASTLARMRAGALADIRRDMGEIRERDIRWCVTVPAIWSSAQKQFMREAIEASGFVEPAHVLIGIEPEAAALYCLTTPGRALDGRGRGTRPRTDTDTRVVVVDCGGGTVDISAYEARPAEDGRLALAEIGEGSIGDALGSQYVNHALRRQVLADRFGAELLTRLESGALRESINSIEDEWEGWKHHVSVNAEAGCAPVVAAPATLTVPQELWAALPLPVCERLTELADGEERTIVLPAGEVQRLFDTVIDPILDLIAGKLAEVRREVGPAPVTMVLVGGFVHNEYLRRRIRHRFDGEAVVLRPNDPRKAVLRGGVHFCYAPEQIWERRSARTYGIRQSLKFRHGVDDPRRMHVDHSGEGWRCADRFLVVVTRGRAVKVDQSFVHRTRPTLRDQAVLDLEFFWTDQLDPQYVDEPDVFPLQRMKVDISATVGLPVKQRYVRVEMFFGETTIRAVAVNERTGSRAEVEMQFDPLFAALRRPPASPSPTSPSPANPSTRERQ